MRDAFLTITEAVRYTGKSRRTLHRLAQHLAKSAPDQVMREHTSKGQIWRIDKQCLQPVTSTDQSTSQALAPSPGPLTAPPPNQFEEKYLAVAQQGYGSLMAMHQEVKQAYEVRLVEKEQRIAKLNQALTRLRQSWWARWFGD